MIRNIKALGLTAVAACATSAMFASAAQAAPDGVFTAGLTPGTHTQTVVTGHQYGTEAENVFVTAGGASKVSCENSGVTLEGTDTDGTWTEITITPTYKDCTANGLPMTVTMNGCKYNLDRPEEISGPDTTWTSTVDLECTSPSVVELDIYLGGTKTAHNTKICTETILPANNLGHVIFHNITGSGGVKDDLTATVDLSNMPVEEHGAACPDGNTKATTLTCTSNITLTAESEAGASHDLWISTGL